MKKNSLTRIDLPALELERHGCNNGQEKHCLDREDQETHCWKQAYQPRVNVLIQGELRSLTGIVELCLSDIRRRQSNVSQSPLTTCLPGLFLFRLYVDSTHSHVEAISKRMV